MDGDSSAKTFEQGANSALKETEMSSGIHESVNQIVCLPTLTIHNGLLPSLPSDRKQPSVGDKTNGTGPSVFSKDGPVGSLFQGEPLPPTFQSLILL